MSSRYLLKPPRTLREACRDVRAPCPELMDPGLITCDRGSCPHRELCGISEQIERHRSERPVKMETESSAKRA